MEKREQPRKKTIFDTLNLPAFRDKPGLFIGSRDIHVLEMWIQGYISACMDAQEAACLNTPGGVPVTLLQDYIALRESDKSTGGIAFICTEAANKGDGDAWTRFFMRLDEFMLLRIVSVKHMYITAAMKEYAASLSTHFETDAAGKLVPCSFRERSLTKTVLTDGLCYITRELPEGERVWKEAYYSIMPEREADDLVRKLFGTVKWQ